MSVCDCEFVRNIVGELGVYFLVSDNDDKNVMRIFVEQFFIVLTNKASDPVINVLTLLIM